VNSAQKIVVGVVGNPNCGKTTLFNKLTGTRQQVGNWPGVTVEKKIGRFKFRGVEIELVDLPGTYSLEIAEHEISVDEQIARDYIASRQADLIINIVDAANLERNLYLTSQLLEMKVPVLIALNMLDVAKSKGMTGWSSSARQYLSTPERSRFRKARLITASPWKPRSIVCCRSWNSQLASTRLMPDGWPCG
jgi:small GTP-binding protein